MPSSRLLSLLIICIALPEWLTGLLHKKREGADQQDPTQPKENSAKVGVDIDVDKAMEELRLYSFEREVLSSALTTIYEAEVKGILKVSERDKLAAPYKEDFKRLEKKIDERRRIADLLDLEKERKELQTYYSEKMTDIDKKIEELRTLIGSLPQFDLTASTPTPIPSLNENLTTNNLHPNEQLKETNTSSSTQPIGTSNKTKTNTEQKIEALREEVLRAIERLEQMESEG